MNFQNVDKVFPSFYSNGMGPEIAQWFAHSDLKIILKIEGRAFQHLRQIGYDLKYKEADKQRLLKHIKIPI